MDKLQALLNSLEAEFQVEAKPTEQELISTQDTNLENLRKTREQIQAQLDMAFESAISYIQYTRASNESLIRLLEHIDAEMARLSALPAPPLPTGRKQA